ncbi:UTRA domain-containing protein [Microbispora sp. NBRC 16548]|uniref:UTRA domain-containing protein n=1 Tax=Microbispora sp. NBRC 16548 TaxID=3030994 RepID=UPI0024A5945F|nr:UTRA domain-containing protein [Microbispora sp. NBRC 16548]GLX03884.1 hypothetical protein Misp03_08110 [Microbispora sp. NBRC 16548]
MRLPKLGWVRIRWTRPLGGRLRNATVLKDGRRWYIAFCVEDGLVELAPNGKPPVGVDRGVKVAVVTSGGWMCDREFFTPGETIRLKRLQQQLARQRKESMRRAVARAKLARLNARIRNRRADFLAWTANRLTRDHGLVVVEDLKVKNMTASAKGTMERPGSRVRQKAGLNRAILAKGWRGLLTAWRRDVRQRRQGGARPVERGRRAGAAARTGLHRGLLAERYGVRPADALERIEAVAAGEEEAAVLGVEPGVPVLAITRTTSDEQGRAFEFSQDVFRGDRTRVLVHVSGATGATHSAREQGRLVRFPEVTG